MASYSYILVRAIRHNLISPAHVISYDENIIMSRILSSMYSLIKFEFAKLLRTLDYNG